MADQLQRRFDGVDHATMPDLWGAIEVRAQHPAPEPRGPRIAALVLAVIVAAAVIGGLVWALRGRESQPAVQPGVNGDIGYVGLPAGTRRGWLEVLSVDPTTGVVRRVTGSEGSGVSETGAKWSPDGSQVVFERATREQGAFTYSLVLRYADGSERVLRSCSPDDCLADYAWSPDGTKLALVVSAKQAGSLLEVLDLEDGRTTDLCTQARCGPGMAQISWSPDGTRVAFSNAGPAFATIGKSRFSRIWVQEADGSSPAVAITGPLDGCSEADGCRDVGPSWSPDGHMIAFLRLNDVGHTAVAVTVRPDGSDLRVVDSCPGHDGCSAAFAPVWSPDGARFALPIAHDPTTHRPAIRLFTPGNGDTSDLIVCEGCSVLWVVWSPDGRSLAFVGVNSSTYENGIYVMGADGSGLRRLSGVGAVDTLSPIAWLPAGAVPTASPAG